MKLGWRPVCGILGVLCAVAAGHWAARYLSVMGGGCEGCDLFRYARAVRTVVRIEDAGDRMWHSARMLAREGGMEHWGTEAGDFWIPARKAPQLVYMLAEQEIGIYGAPRMGDVVLDCGANFGVFTRKALDSGAVKVIAIEPLPLLAECLKRTFQVEIERGRVVVYAKGVWDREDVLPMRVDEDLMGDSSFVRDMAKRPIINLPLTTIDAITMELSLGKIDFIKMDIEGAEGKALRGATTTISRNKPRLALAAYHLPEDVEELPAIVARIRQDYNSELRCGRPFGTTIRPEVLTFR